MRFQITKVETMDTPHFLKLHLNRGFSTLMITTEAWVEMGTPVDGAYILVKVTREMRT